MDYARDGAIDIYTSQRLIDELCGVLSRQRFVSRLTEVGSSVFEIIEQYLALASLIEAPDIDSVVIRDPDDDAVLACAIASESDLIVSGDKDLLELGQYRETRILSPADFINEIGF